MFKYRSTEGTMPGIYEVITHDDCEFFRKMEWQDGEDISKYVLSVHNPDSDTEEYNRFLNGIDQKFKKNDDEYDIVHYRFLFAGAGDTRKTRAFFTDKSTRDKILPYIMNGLTMEDVNTPVNNKYVCSGLRFTTYESLWLTGSKRIENFDIDRCIVIEDLKNELHYQALEVDATKSYVSDDLQDITNTAEITDGAGMFLPGVFQYTDKKDITKDITAFTARAPWFKGLMVQHDFMAAAKRTSNYVIKDAWGQDHNIFLEGINCIWTTSQLKLWKAYKSWDHYKRFFKELNQYFCMALIPEGKKKLVLSYQPLQDLRGNQQQIRNLLKNQFNKLWKDYGRVDKRTSSNKEDWLYNYELTLKDIGLDQLAIFREVKAMLNCNWIRSKVRDYLRNEFKKMKYGKIKVTGYEPFVSPDWNWVCNKLFGDNMPEVPTNCICCKSLKEEQEVDIVRYPHLYTGAHCLRTNVRIEGLESDAVYVDANGITALLVEADFDGDHLQLFTDKYYLDIIKNETNQKPPIHYTCKSGAKHPVIFDYSEHGVFKELRKSYGGEANVGIPSNLATRIFNDEDYEWDTIDYYVRMLAHMIQGCIDFPKAGESYRLEDEIINKIKLSNKPHFMMYAKELEDNKRLDSLNRKEMIKITRDMFGEELYPEQLTEEQYKEMIKEYKKLRTTYYDSINYGDSMIVKMLNRIKDKYKDNKQIVKRIKNLEKRKSKRGPEYYTIGDICEVRWGENNNKQLKDLIDDLYSEEDQDKRIRVMDFVEMLCNEEEECMNIDNWYAPFEIFRDTKDIQEDDTQEDYDEDMDFVLDQLHDRDEGEEFELDNERKLPEGFVKFIQEFDNKHTHPDYSTRINSQTMFDPIPEIQQLAREEYHKRFKIKLFNKDYKRSCLFKKVLAHPDGTGFAFCQYVWPDELLEYARHFPVRQATSPLDRARRGARRGAPLGGDAVAVPVRVITEDGTIYEYNNIQECANQLCMHRQGVNRNLNNNKFHKIKSLNCKCKFERIDENADGNNN